MLLLMLALCLVLLACSAAGNNDTTARPVTQVSRLGNIRSICEVDKYQNIVCQSVIVSVATVSYQSHKLCRMYLSQADNELIGVRVLGQDISPSTREDSILTYCLDMQALGVDPNGQGYGWTDLWIQLFFSRDSLKEHTAYPLTIETHYEGGHFKKEEKLLFGDRGITEYANHKISSATVYKSASQLFEQTNIAELQLPASTACLQIECRENGKWIQCDLLDNQGSIFIKTEPKGKLKKWMDRYTDHFSERVIHEKDGITYYIIGSWASCGAPAVPNFFEIYWQIGTKYYTWSSPHISTFEGAIVLIEDLHTVSAQ
jgi:hypothetical protein